MINILGYAASAAVLATFLMRSMVPLRLTAILSNVLFLAYGWAADVTPVLLLHLILFPINVIRLAALRDPPAAEPCAAAAKRNLAPDPERG